MTQQPHQASSPLHRLAIECSSVQTSCWKGSNQLEDQPCVFISSELLVQVIDFQTYKLVELLTLFVRIGAMSFVFVVVYRPDPASAVSGSFFVDSADVLERASAFAGCVIVGDVNLHVSDVTNTSSLRFH